MSRRRQGNVERLEQEKSANQGNSVPWSKRQSGLANRERRADEVTGAYPKRIEWR